MRTLSRIALAAAIVVALMPPARAYATQFETVTDYYNGCDSTFLFAGEGIETCENDWVGIGDQEGEWKRVTVHNCETNAVVSTTYYHFCNNAWVQVSAQAFGACDLDC